MTHLATSSQVIKPLNPILQVALAVAHKHDLTLEDLLSPSYRRQIVTVRQALMYELALTTPYSYKAIGRRLNRDHSTVIKGIERHCQRYGLPLPRKVIPRVDRPCKGGDSPEK